MFSAFHCPQCGGTLPRRAIWFTVACPYCKALVTRDVETVRRADFRAAWTRSQQHLNSTDLLHIGPRSYRLLGLLGEGAHSTVHLAEALGAVPARVVVKLARTMPSRLLHEAEALRQLAALPGAASAYFSQRLPQVEHAGQVLTQGGRRDALVLRHAAGFAPSLAQVLQAHPGGLREVRHVVWLWRRTLEVLAYVHAAGWAHGDLKPAHWLVHPGDHGVLLVGWGRAQSGGDPVRDLQQSAWAMRSLLAGEGDDAPAIPGRVPAPLAELLRVASEDAATCRHLGAAGLEQALVNAAADAFGPPVFIPFDPYNA